MNIAFQKRDGDPSLGIAFFWKLEVEAEPPATITDRFIPELYFDYFFIKEGKVTGVDESRGMKFTLPEQALKTIHTRAATLIFSTPLVLYGARLSLRFAESFWEEMKASSFLSQAWVGKAAAPSLNESIRWKNCLVYGTTKNHIQTVLGKGKISLIFFEGASLKDKYGFLEGEGNKARTMGITSPDFNKEALTDYVAQTLRSEK